MSPFDWSGAATERAAGHPVPNAGVRYDVIDSPLGDLLATSDGAALTGLFMPPHTGVAELDSGWNRVILRDVRVQLAAYFAGELTDFEIPTAPRGSAFQRAVWAGLCDIGYGCTESYGSLAARLGSPGGSRAVGLAAGRNPVCVVIPCHRLVGADGSLTGYAGGLPRKRLLLELEAANAQGDRLW